MIVVDAGAVYELVCWNGFGRPVADALASHRGEAWAPHLLDVEVLHALRRAEHVVGRGSLSAAVDALRRLPVERVSHEPLVERIWELRHVCSAYDAAYVALAERLGPGCGLVTTDRRLARAAATIGGIELTVVPVS